MYLEHREAGEDEYIHHELSQRKQAAVTANASTLHGSSLNEGMLGPDSNTNE